MKKKIIIPVAIILVIALIPTIIIMRKSASSQGSLSSASKMETALKTINKNLKDTLPSLEVTTIDTKDAELVSSYTYLSNPSVVESLVVSEPLITSQAYLAILLKVKDTVFLLRLRGIPYRFFRKKDFQARKFDFCRASAQ